MSGLIQAAEEMMTGRRGPRTPVEWAMRAAAYAVRPFYGLGVSFRGLAYSRAWFRSVTVQGARVVSVGNITLGGSGKTPLVIALAEELRERGHRVGVVLRGYGAPAQQAKLPVLVRDARRLIEGASTVGDEAALLAERLPGVVVVAGRQRVAGVQLAAEAPHHCDVILLDDGFQHRALVRQTDLVLLDPGLPAGAWRLFPVGYLREPLRALQRATCIAGYADDEAKPSGKALADLMQQQGLGRLGRPLLARRRLLGLRRIVPTADGEACLTGRIESPPKAPWRIHAFAGIAHPERLVAAWSRFSPPPAGVSVVPLGDHRAPTREELDAFFREAARMQGVTLACTEKDAVKVARLLKPDDPPLFAVVLGVELLEADRWVTATTGA